MREEIRKILKMLEEGRITADEAERLIRAIEEKEEREESPPWRSRRMERRRRWRDEDSTTPLERGIERLVMGVLAGTFEALSKSMGFIPGLGETFSGLAEGFKNFGPEYFNLPEDTYVVQLLEGDVEVETSESSNLKPGNYRRKRLVVPPGSNVAVFVVDGNIHLKGDFNVVITQAVDGDVHLHGKFSRMTLRLVDGDAHVHFNGKGLTVEVDVLSGEIVADAPMDDQGRIVLGDGSSRLDGKIVDGDLHVHLHSGVE
jgi:hypothetical protein